MRTAEPSEPLLNELPAGAAHFRIVALCFAAWIFDFYDLVLYSFLLVPIARELHLSPADSSLALGMSLLMTAVGGVLFGYLGDRFGRRPAIAATVAIYGVGTLLSALPSSLTALIVCRSITGLGMGGGWAPGQAMIAESAPAARRARYAAYVQTGAPLGILIAAAAGGFVQPHIGWRLTFALSAAPAALVLLAVLRWMPESDVWLRDRARTEAARFELSALRPYRHIVALLFMIILLNSEAYWFTYSWMPGYLVLRRGLSDAAAGRLMIKMQLGGVIGYAVFGALADRFGRRPVFSAFAALMAVGLLPPTILWNWSARIPHLTAAAMAAAGFGTGLWSGAAPMISELLPTRVRNIALGTLLNVTRGLQFFTPIVITALSARIGFGAALSLGALFSAAGGAAVWAIPETRGRSITGLDAG